MPEAFTGEVVGMTSAFLWRTAVFWAKVVDSLQVETSKGLRSGATTNREQ